MKKITKYIIEFYSPGLAYPNTTIKEYDDMPDVNKIEFSTFAFAFGLYVQTNVVDGEDVYIGKMNFIKKYYHPDSKVMTYEECESHPSATEALLNNMRANRWKKIICDRFNYFREYDVKDTEILKGVSAK